MAGKKKKGKKLPRWTTPKGIAVFPYLDKPDTKFKKEGQYRTGLAIPIAEAEDIVEKIKDAAKRSLRDAKENESDDAKAAALPFGTDEKYPGCLVFKFKMTASGEKDGEKWTNRPALFDAHGNVIKVPPKIGSGSTLRVSFFASPYFSPKDEEAGVSLRLVAVQLIKLVEWGADAASYGFGQETDGFEASQAEEAEDADDLEDETETKDADGEDEF